MHDDTPAASSGPPQGRPPQMMKIGLETVACDLCHSTDARTLLRVRDRMYGIPGEFELVECARCGLRYLNPRPDAAGLAAYYPDLDYHAFEPKRGLKGALLAQLRRSEAKILLSGASGAPRVLEIGCGTGDLLVALRERGAHVTGVEPNAAAARQARDAHNLDVRTGMLDQVSFERSEFDLVVLKHSLEHVPSPRATLTTIHGLLKPGGRVVCWVPNVASVDAWLFGRFWRGLDAPRHLYVFSPSTLQKLLDGCNFRVVRVAFSPAPNEWAGSVELWLRDLGIHDSIAKWFGVASPLAMAAWLPVSSLFAVAHATGRMRVEALSSGPPEGRPPQT